MSPATSPGPPGPPGPPAGPGPPRSLEIGACRSECAWSTTGDHIDGEEVFACSGCGSEWVPSEPWTPIESTGQVPDAVQRARRGRGRG